ncbi:MAG: hypothetical protein MUE73_01120 [Planctomycetes bacterium]|jgi:hypothetical protein|nr:hypothetical protein [Planctomycetota bacterium]
MNVLGLVLTAALRRRYATVGCRLRGLLRVDAGGMRALVSFAPEEILVSRREDPARAEVSGSLATLVAALARPGLRDLLRVKVRGNRLFALRAARALRP